MSRIVEPATDTSWEAAIARVGAVAWWMLVVASAGLFVVDAFEDLVPSPLDWAVWCLLGVNILARKWR